MRKVLTQIKLSANTTLSISGSSHLTPSILGVDAVNLLSNVTTSLWGVDAATMLLDCVVEVEADVLDDAVGDGLIRRVVGGLP